MTEHTEAAILGYCETCGEPLRLTPFGLVGSGGVCRHPRNPNDDDEGQHVLAGGPISGTGGGE